LNALILLSKTHLDKSHPLRDHTGESPQISPFLIPSSFREIIQDRSQSPSVRNPRIIQHQSQSISRNEDLPVFEPFLSSIPCKTCKKGIQKIPKTIRFAITQERIRTKEKEIPIPIPFQINTPIKTKRPSTLRSHTRPSSLPYRIFQTESVKKRKGIDFAIHTYV